MVASPIRSLCVTLAIAAIPLRLAVAADVGCMGGFTGALAKGHFSGPVICSKNADFVLMGITSGPVAYLVYDYRYKSRPSGGQIGHGGNGY